MTTFDIFTNQRQIWKDYKDVYTLARRALPFIIGVVIGGFIFASDEGYLTNLYTEIMSIIATVGILDFFYQRRDTENLKKRLVREASSRSNETAKTAIEWLRAEGWLTGEKGILQKKDLSEANLEGADVWGANLKETNLLEANLLNSVLRYANLQEVNLDGANLGHADLHQVNLYYANLTSANLQEASLERANLTQADLEYVNLQEAVLFGANLQEAYLGRANLQQANLFQANMKKANLECANLTQAYLIGANFQKAYLLNANIEDVVWEDEIDGEIYTATLPDGTKWTPDTDMTHFTDPHHPDFWRPPLEKE